jgi:hypothetical protein
MMSTPSCAMRFPMPQLTCSWTAAQTAPGQWILGTAGTGTTGWGFGDPITLTFVASGGTVLRLHGHPDDFDRRHDHL